MAVQLDRFDSLNETSFSVGALFQSEDEWGQIHLKLVFSTGGDVTYIVLNKSERAALYNLLVGKEKDGPFNT